jgi:hypothetical protein
MLTRVNAERVQEEMREAIKREVIEEVNWRSSSEDQI